MKPTNERLIEKVTEELQAIAYTSCYTQQELDELRGTDEPNLSSWEYLRYVDDIVKTIVVDNIKILEIRRLEPLEKEDIPAYFLYAKIKYNLTFDDDDPESEEGQYILLLDKDEDMLLDCLHKDDIERDNIFEDCWVGDIEIEELTTNEVMAIVENSPVIFIHCDNQKR